MNPKRSEPKVLGILRGRESGFPEDLIRAVESQGRGMIRAEMASIGAEPAERPLPYDLIYDRISHDYPMYHVLLRAAAAHGTYVVPNPFLTAADDKFLGAAVAHRLGIPSPRTVVLPLSGSLMLHDITAHSLRNLRWLDDKAWGAVFDYVGFPAWLKPCSAGGWLGVFKVHSPEEFFRIYNQAIFHGEMIKNDPAADQAVRNWLGRTTVMILQQDIPWERFARCWYIGGEVLVARYTPPRKKDGEVYGKYQDDPGFFGPALYERLRRYVQQVNSVMGYEINTAEFAIRGDEPYLIDFLNFTCDFNPKSIAPFYERCLELVARYLTRCLTDPAARLQAQNRDRAWGLLATGQAAPSARP
ncbi:MAG: hypothetical protein GYA21_00375 [Myxococcales bacterium]|nr:hypothetical protein [Myxococcales bacterium]